MSNRLPWLFLATAGLLTLLCAGEVFRYHDVLKATALLGSGALALLSAGVLTFEKRLSTMGDRLCKPTLIAVALAWFVWACVIAYAHVIDGWDEGAYFLSGMALRGYNVPYAAHRAPVTSWLCAAFYGVDRLLNPALLGVLLVTMYSWVRRLLGPLPAVLSLFVLLCQDLLLNSSVDIMSELPAALLVLLGFVALARERFWWSALWFTLVVFARWNLAPIPAVVFLAVLIRFSMRQALKFAGVGAVVFAAWYGITVAMGEPNPLMCVYRENFLAGVAWSSVPAERPNFRIRLLFYSRDFFFLTPPTLLALIANPIHNLRTKLRTEYWVALVVVPLACLAYMATMLMMGGLFSRFMTPLIPSAVVSLLAGLWRFSEDYLLLPASRLRLWTAALFLTCAMGLWPMSAIWQAHANYKTPPVFSPGLRKRLAELDRNVTLYGVPFEPLSLANGHPAMVQARHRILFPSARRNSRAQMLEEPDTPELAHKLTAACHTGDLMVIPAKYVSALPVAAVVFSDSDWAVVRHP